MTAPPKTPKGMERCTAPMVPEHPVEGRKGERFQYDVELLGMGVGRVNVEAMRRGMLRGHKVTEYRAWVEPGALVSRMMTLEGQFAALVPDGDYRAMETLITYSFRSDKYLEKQRIGRDGRVTATRSKNGKQKKPFDRDYGGPVIDFMSAFNLVRRLPASASGCAVMVSDGKSYTVWLERVGSETIEVVGKDREADRFRVRYGSDKTKKVRTVYLWTSRGRERLPYRLEAETKYAPIMTLRAYTPGRRS